MQTKKQAMKRIRSMMKDVREEILKECERLLSSGGIDLDSASDSDGQAPFRVPKVVLVAAMRRASNQWGPLRWDKEGHRDIRNLERL